MVGIGSTKPINFFKQQIQQAALGTDDLATHQVDGLNTIGAFVNTGNAHVTGNLLHAMLANIAMATETLDTQIRHFTATFSKEPFANRRQQRHQLIRLLLFRTLTMQCRVQLHGGEITEHPATFHQRLLGQ